MTRDWKLGERVTHAARPEWGVGEVRGAEAVQHEGAWCQRLTIRFDRAGVKTITTALAELRPAETRSDSSGSAEPAAEPDAGDLSAAMVRVPDPACDPFRTLSDRLAASLRLYRYSAEGASLLDWAAAQSGLKDPLARFNRHELEQLFARFQANLESHLKRLMQDARRQDPGMIAGVVSAAPSAAKAVLRRIDALR